MKEQERIAHLLKSSIDGEAWFGPALFEALDGVSALHAAATPIANAHSMWALTAHIGTWVEVSLSRYRGQGPDRVPPERNFPPVPDDPTETAWLELKEQVRKAHEDWYRELEKMPDGRLHKPSEEGFPTIAEILYGVFQHTAYHAGQIVLLKKAL